MNQEIEIKHLEASDLYKRPTILWQNAAYSQVNVQQYFKPFLHLWFWSIT